MTGFYAADNARPGGGRCCRRLLWRRHSPGKETGGGPALLLRYARAEDRAPDRRSNANGAGRFPLLPGEVGLPSGCLARAPSVRSDGLAAGRTHPVAHTGGLEVEAPGRVITIRNDRSRARQLARMLCMGTR